MTTLYILGGPPRTGKSTIMAGLMAAHNVAYVPADALTESVRSTLTGEPYQMLRGVSFSGTAEHKSSMTGGITSKPFGRETNESELTLLATMGVLDYYRRSQLSVAFEGQVFTPDWVAELDTTQFTVRAAFVGYTDPAHVESILTYARAHPHDWVNQWLDNEETGEAKLRGWVEEQAIKCRQLQTDAGRLGYPFFDLSTYDRPEKNFEDYLADVQDYFIET